MRVNPKIFELAEEAAAQKFDDLGHVLEMDPALRMALPYRRFQVAYEEHVDGCSTCSESVFAECPQGDALSEQTMHETVIMGLLSTHN